MSPRDLLSLHPAPWRVLNDPNFDYAIIDALGEHVLVEEGMRQMYSGMTLARADALCVLVNHYAAIHDRNFDPQYIREEFTKAQP